MRRTGEGIVLAVLLELAPAALFGCAVAFAAATALGAPLAAVPALALGAAAAGGAWLSLRGFRGDAQAFSMPRFDEILLEPHLGRELAGDQVELLLEDVLAPAEPDSRVVRLFDRQPRRCGELQEVDRHLRSAVRPIPTPPDATEALHEALASLRQSLR